MVGNPSWADDKHRMCFNAAKSYATGWYSDNNGHLDLTPTKGSIELVGIDDYVNGKFDAKVDADGNNQQAAVILRLQRSNGPDFYLMFNRKQGINSQVPTAANKVTIISQENVFKSQSWFQVALYEKSEPRRFKEWDGTFDLVVEVCGRVRGRPFYARVIFYMDDGVNSITCDDPPHTLAPSPSPDDPGAECSLVFPGKPSEFQGVTCTMVCEPH